MLALALGIRVVLAARLALVLVVGLVLGSLALALVLGSVLGLVLVLVLVLMLVLVSELALALALGFGQGFGLVLALVFVLALATSRKRRVVDEATVWLGVLLIVTLKGSETLASDHLCGFRYRNVRHGTRCGKNVLKPVFEGGTGPLARVARPRQ